MKTISICIAAYNAENNIVHIANSLLNQKESGFVLNKLYIHSDAGSDKTVSLANGINDPRVVVIDNKNRRGYAGSLKYMIDLFEDDLLLTFNDDIRIDDDQLVTKIVNQFSEDKVGMVCGRPLPLKPKNIIESGIVSTFNTYDKGRYEIDNGAGLNFFTVDGKIMAFSKDFAKNVKFLEKVEEMGNVDSYLYFACITTGFKYRNARDAVAYYRNPTTINDYIQWVSRNNSNRKILRKQFGTIVDTEFNKLKTSILLKHRLIELIKNPLGSGLILVLRNYVAYRSKQIEKNFTSHWETVTTTKDLN